MSIVKNTTGTDNAVTVMKLEKATTVNGQKVGLLASPPLPSGHPLIGFEAKYYLELKDFYFKLGFYPRAGETVIMKVQVNPNASGILYGINTNDVSVKRYIRANNGNLEWVEGTTTIRTEPIDGKVHLVGYQGYDDNGVRKMKTYYDKVLYGGGSTVGYSDKNAVFGGEAADTPSSVFTSSDSWAVRLYEIIAISYPSASDTTMHTFHYYAAMDNSSTPVACLMETRHDLTGVVGSGTTKSAVDFPTIGYGIQLHDLKTICGSGYNDIVAILAEDGGIDTSVGFSEVGEGEGSADAPCTLTQDTDKRKFAISLKNLPRPSGWTYAEHDSDESEHHADNYVGGQLHEGRTPKWSIWQDAIAFGFYPEALVGAGYKMKFNLFKRPDTSARPSGSGDAIRMIDDFRLEKFHGYNTNVETCHPPVLEFSDTELSIHVHNGAIAKCLAADVMAGAPGALWNGSSAQGTAEFVKDNDCIFILNETVGGSVHSRLGNLAPWNYSYDEMDNVGWMPKGYKVTCAFLQGAANYLVSPEHKSEVANKYLTGSADAAVKELYRVTGFTDSLKIGDYRWYLLDYLEQHSNQADLWATLTMIEGNNNPIDCSSFLPSKKVQVSALHNPSIEFGATNYRMIMNTEASIGIVTGAYYSQDWTIDQKSERVPTKVDYKAHGNDDNDETTLWLPFIKCNSSGPIIDTYAPADTHDYIGVMELFYIQSSAVLYGNVIKTNVNKSEFQSSYLSAYNEWKSTNETTSRYAYWKNGVKSRIDLRSGNNDELYTSVRFFAATGTDFGVSGGGSYHNIPANATAIVTVYEKATAPTFWKLRNAVWDEVHHTPVFQNINGYWYQFANPWIENTEGFLDQCEFAFFAFTKSGSTYTKVDTVGSYYVHMWKNGEYAGYEVIAPRQGGTTKRVFGLDGAYWSDAQCLEVTFDDLQRGDVIEIEIKATATI